MSNNKIKKYLLFIVKVLCTVLPLYLIYSQIDFGKLGQSLKCVVWWTVPLFVISIFILMLLQGTRWWLLMLPFNKSVSLRKTLYCHFVAQFYATFLPTSAAQDFVRAALLQKHSDGHSPWAATFMSRLNGLLLLLLFSFTGIMLIGKSAIPSEIINAVFIVCALFAIVCLLSFSKKFTRPFRPLIERILPAKTAFKLSEIRELIYCYRDKKKNMILNILLTAVAQFMTIVPSMILIYGITGKVFFKEMLAFHPVIEIITITVPLTPGGVGIRDGLMALFFKYLQLSNEQLGAFLILSYIAIMMRLIGAIPVLYSFIRKHLISTRK